MALTFGFFSDSALASPLTGSLQHAKLASTSTEDKDFRIYLGSTEASTQLQRATSPGVNEVTVEVSDSDTGTAPATTAVKLATTQAGLDTATAGASLALGTEILSGSANAATIWVRTTNALTGITTDSTLGLLIDDVEEVPQ